MSLVVKSGQFHDTEGKHHTRHSVWVICLSGMPYGCGVLFIWYQAVQSPTTDKRFGSTLSFYNHPSGVREQSADNAPYQKPMQPTLHPNPKRTLKRHPFSERIRAVELHKQGLGSKWIAAQLGVDDSQVRSWIRKYKAYGIESLRPYGRKAGESKSNGKSQYVNQEEQFRNAYQLYAETQESMASIARRYGLDYGSFRYYLLRYHPELKERRRKLLNPYENSQQ